MVNLPLDPARTALLVMDFQKPIVERIAAGQSAVLDAAVEALAAARQRGLLVVYVVVGFRPGFPEIHPHNRRFGALKTSGTQLSTEIHAALAPRPEEVIVTKHRVGAFHGTDLDMILRAHGVDTLVLTGLATSGVVLSTVRHGSDADYRLIVLRDACADPDAAVHACLMDKVFASQAEIATAAELAQALASSPA